MRNFVTEVKGRYLSYCHDDAMLNIEVKVIWERRIIVMRENERS